MAKELSEEEQKLVERRKIAKDTLEGKIAQIVIGGSKVKKNPYDFGRYSLEGSQKIYEDSKASEEFNKKRQELYNQKKDRWDPDNAEEPLVGDGEVVQSYFRQRDECFAILTLGELESIVKGVAGNSGPKLEIRDELKNYSGFELQEKMIDRKKGVLDPSKLSKEEQIAHMYIEELKETYTKACGKKAGDGNFYAEDNQKYAKLAIEYEKANPKKK